MIVRRFVFEIERRFVLGKSELTRSWLQGTDALSVLPQEDFGNCVQRRVSNPIKLG